MVVLRKICMYAVFTLFNRTKHIYNFTGYLLLLSNNIIRNKPNIDFDIPHNTMQPIILYDDFQSITNY